MNIRLWPRQKEVNKYGKEKKRSTKHHLGSWICRYGRESSRNWIIDIIALPTLAIAIRELGLVLDISIHTSPHRPSYTNYCICGRCIL